MQLGKKSKTIDILERVKGDLVLEDENPAANSVISQVSAENSETQPAPNSSLLDHGAIHVTIAETLSARLSREGVLNTFEVKGDLQLKVSDPKLTKVKLIIETNTSHNVQFRTHPNVDKNLFNESKIVQMNNVSKGFPINNSVGVLRWRTTPRLDDPSSVPITFTVWSSKISDDSFNMTIEYELTGNNSLSNVSITIPYSTGEPLISSQDVNYDISEDSIEWSVGWVDELHPTGSFEFESQAGDENDFFPMQVKFANTKPYIDFQVWKPHRLHSLLLNNSLGQRNNYTGDK